MCCAFLFHYGFYYGYFPQKLQYFLHFDPQLVFIWTFIYLSQSLLTNKFPVLLYSLQEKRPQPNKIVFNLLIRSIFILIPCRDVLRVSLITLYILWLLFFRLPVMTLICFGCLLPWGLNESSFQSIALRPPQFIFLPSFHILRNRVLWTDVPSHLSNLVFLCLNVLSLSAPGVASSLPLPLSFCGFARIPYDSAPKCRIYSASTSFWSLFVNNR